MKCLGEIRQVLLSGSLGSATGAGWVNPAFIGVGAPCALGPWRKETEAVGGQGCFTREGGKREELAEEQQR